MTAYDDTVHGPVPTPEESWRALANTPQVELKIKRLHREALIPVYATDGSACFDLHSTENVTIMDGDSDLIGTGLAAEVPPGFVLAIFPRSGNGIKHGIRLRNGTGIIDPDYRGEIKVSLHNLGYEPFRVAIGDRIAQGMLLPIPRVKLVEAEELTDTARGAGGFGSTGK